MTPVLSEYVFSLALNLLENFVGYCILGWKSIVIILRILKVMLKSVLASSIIIEESNENMIFDNSV